MSVLADPQTNRCDAEARSIEQAKEALIDGVEARLAVEESVRRIFQIRFTVTRRPPEKPK